VEYGKYWITNVNNIKYTSELQVMKYCQAMRRAEKEQLKKSVKEEYD
jgi:ribosomal protein L33